MIAGFPALVRKLQ